MLSDEILNAGFRSFSIGVADGSRCGAQAIGCKVADISKDPSTFHFSTQLSEKRFSLCWDITLTLTDASGQPICPIFPEERRSHLLLGGSLKSHIIRVEIPFTLRLNLPLYPRPIVPDVITVIFGEGYKFLMRVSSTYSVFLCLCHGSKCSRQDPVLIHCQSVLLPYDQKRRAPRQCYTPPPDTIRLYRHSSLNDGDAF